MSERRAQVVSAVLEAARTLHGKHDMFQESEMSVRGARTNILIFGFRHMITQKDLQDLRQVAEENYARVESLGILPEKIGATRKYTGVIELIFTVPTQPTKRTPASKRRSGESDDEEDEDSARPKRRQPFCGQESEQESSLSLFSRIKRD